MDVQEDDFTNAIYPCHFERSEKSKVGNRFVCNDFRFLTAFGMTTLGICEIVSHRIDKMVVARFMLRWIVTVFS